MPRPRPPASSFGEALMSALMQGAIRGFKVQLPFRRAVKFRQRLYQLRASMRDEQHPKYNLVSRVQIFITNLGAAPQDKNKLVTVEVAPADSQYEDALRSAGIEPKLDVEIEDRNSELPSAEDALEAFFGDLKS